MSDHPDWPRRLHDHLVEPMFEALHGERGGGAAPGADIPSAAPAGSRDPEGPAEPPDGGDGGLAGPVVALAAGLGVGLALVQVLLRVL